MDTRLAGRAPDRNEQAQHDRAEGVRSIHDAEPTADVSTYCVVWPPLPITSLHRSSAQGELHGQLRPAVARAWQREAHRGYVTVHTISGGHATIQDAHPRRRIIDQGGIA